MLRVLRAPHARRLFLASCVARLPLGAMGLLFVLQTKHLTGSYTASGLAAGAYALGLGVSNPALARIVDARGQTTVLRAGAAAAAAAIVAYAALPAGTPLGAIVVSGGFVAARFSAGPGRLALLAGAWGVAHALVGAASGPAAFPGRRPA